MSSFNLYVPTRIHFGRGCLERNIVEERDVLSGNVLIVSTGRSLDRLGYIDRLVNSIKDNTSAQEVVVYKNISANPDVSEIDEAVALGKNHNVDVVIGFGGGSALDASKAASAAIGMNTTSTNMFREGISPDENTLPIIAIPTTAGTGSELSKAAIVSDRENKKKGGIRGEHLYPTVAIVDSTFTESVPISITAETGFDVLAHAMESYVSKASNIYTRELSRQAICIVRDNLQELMKNPDNVQAREKMSYASMIMGINLGNASTALPHRLQYPVGSNSNSSHGAGLAALYTTWIRYEYLANADVTRKMLSILFQQDVENEDVAAELMRGYISSLGLNSRLRDIGIHEELVWIMDGQVTGNLANDPANNIDDIVSKIYREAY